MNVVMAEAAASAQESPVDFRILRCTLRKRRGRMPTLVVALLAQSWLSNPEQADVIAAVRLVAVQAALANGRVLPQERPPLVGVTAVAILVDAVLRNQLLGDGPVNVMATRTLEFPFAHGHVGPV